MDGYTRANRANWNAWTAINAASVHYDVAGFKAGKSTLNAIERDELSGRKQLEVFQVVRGLEALFVGQRREHDPLQRLELRSMFGARRRDDQTVGQHTPVGTRDGVHGKEYILPVVGR